MKAKKQKFLLIEECEKTHHAIEILGPTMAIRIRMQELEFRQKSLVEIFGSKGIVSEVLKDERNLSVNMIHNLSNKLTIAARILVRSYEQKH